MMVYLESLQDFSTSNFQVVERFITAIPYGNNQTLHKNVICNDGASVALKIEMLETELEYDYVTVYDRITGRKILSEFEKDGNKNDIIL